MRLYVALFSQDGKAQIVNASRPASLIAFSDAHEGKDSPENARELAWLVHHSLGIEEDLDDWIGSIEDLSPDPADLRLAQKIEAGETTLQDALDAEIAAGGGLAAELAFPGRNGEEPEPGKEAEQPDPTPATAGEESSPA